ncbi:MAG: zinc-ribbon domain-containing protein [Acidobacteriota bacterium]|nr:zinc-ribbon domain-containing protein [Acidobacteriota bacterium]
MYCPRCGSQNPDATKFCRQCGLALTQVTGYVASGGTGQLVRPQPIAPKPPNLVATATEGLSPKQKMVLTILLLVFSPAIFKVFGETTGMGGLGDSLAKISAILMPIGIIFTVMRYKAQQRRQEQAMTQQPPYPPIHQPIYQAMPPVMPQGLPQPGQQSAQQPVAPSRNYQPVYQQPSPPPTNPLPGSVIEDETRRFQ